MPPRPRHGGTTPPPRRGVTTRLRSYLGSGPWCPGPCRTILVRDDSAGTPIPRRLLAAARPWRPSPGSDSAMTPGRSSSCPALKPGSSSSVAPGEYRPRSRGPWLPHQPSTKLHDRHGRGHRCPTKAESPPEGRLGSCRSLDDRSVGPGRLGDGSAGSGTLGGGSLKDMAGGPEKRRPTPSVPESAPPGVVTGDS